MEKFRKYIFHIYFYQFQLYMLVNYRSYYRLIFTAVTTLAEEKTWAQKELDKSHQFRN